MGRRGLERRAGEGHAQGLSDMTGVLLDEGGHFPGPQKDYLYSFNIHASEYRGIPFKQSTANTHVYTHKYAHAAVGFVRDGVMFLFEDRASALIHGFCPPHM